MHPDEQRDPGHLRELILRHAATQPQKLFDELQVARRRIRTLEATVVVDKSNIRTLNARVKDLTAEKVAHAQSAEDTVGVTELMGSELDESEVAASGRAESEEDGDAASSPLHNTAGPATPTTEGLVDALRDEPSAERLDELLTRLWTDEGEITRVASLVREFFHLVPELPVRRQQIADRILGTEALVRSLPSLVPPRSRGAAYLAEKGRVLYCAYSTPMFHSNGYSVRTEGVVSGLKAAGADVTVLARAGYPWDITTVRPKPQRRRHVETLHGVEWVHLPEGHSSNLAPDVYINVAADAVVREATRQRPSLVHAASNYLNALPALMAARRLGLPFVYEVRGLWEVTEASVRPGWKATERYAHQASMEAFVAREADAVLAITQEIKDELVRRGVPDEKISLLPNAVNTDDFLPLPKDHGYAKASGIRTDVPVIGFAGSLVAYEGLLTLLQAANILRGRKVDFQVVIAGSGGVYRDLKNYQVRNKLKSRVKFVGRRPSQEIPRLMSCVDIVACPRLSLPVTEMVSPLKPLEAFSASKPVVLSDVSPHRVLVGALPHQTDGPRGLLSRAGDPKSLADALQRLIEDPELRATQGQSGRLWVVDERQWQNLGPGIRHVHDQATKHCSAVARPGRSLEKLRIGVIADEFTTETIRRSATVIPLDPLDFARQLCEEQLDLVFVESAWSGNGGQWHRRVGRYSDEEHGPLRELLTRCRAGGVPSVFWNKEDPVHIERFRVTGALCDHVFTTDADMIPEYLHEARHFESAGAVTASSMPFYAQPAIHNPLPGRRPLEDTVSYAGTYYGDRYPERMRQLDHLLGVAAPHGLAIYDRQLTVPGSPYRFPGQYERTVRGALPYDEVIDSYRAHAVNLNVNSVATSPTMFSRRVVEIAACGGVVLSTWSRGIHETFGSAIPSSNDDLQCAALLAAWTSDPEERLREVWLQLRTVLRSHTVETALVVLARTAGLVVDGFRLPEWGTTVRPAQVPALLAQSVPPAAVHLVEDDAAARRNLEGQGIRVTSGVQDRPAVDFWAHVPQGAGRTWAEDLLQATRWGNWDKISAHELSPGQGARHIAVPGENVVDEFGMARSALWLMGDPQCFRDFATPKTLTVTRTQEESHEPLHRETHSNTTVLEERPRVLVAGHDLKFAASWIEHLRVRGVPVVVDRWSDHAHHDEEESLALLDGADTVFCEWGLGNAVWYSHHVSDRQRLLVRVHAQEIRGPYLKRIQHERVSNYLFVSQLVKEAAITSHGLPREKCLVVPNIVRSERLRQDKLPGARKTVGFVGLVPQLKRLDRAVDLIEELVRADSEFRLLIKGKRPDEYAWMLKREDELAWYRQCYERIDRLNAQQRSEVVRFEAHGDDMAQWYRTVGYGVSVSDHESFHLTLPDAAASGAAPVSLDWPGADLIYPREWLVSSVPQMARRILELSRDEAQRAQFIDRAGRFVQEAFDESLVHSALDAVVRVKESDLS